MNYLQLDNIKCTVLRYLPLKKYHDLETWFRSHSRSLEMTPFNRLHVISLSQSAVTLPLAVPFVRWHDVAANSQLHICMARVGASHGSSKNC